MSQTSSPRIGGLLLRLLCSFVLAFSLIGICGGSIGTAVTGAPSLLTAQISKQDAARKVYDALKSQFETEYNATAVPADVYLDALSADWLEDAMKQQVTDSYQNPADKTVPDFSALEQSITDYFERYAAENHCEKDSTYDTKLAQTIQNAEHTIQDALDVYQLDTLKNAGLWQKLISRTHKPLMLLTVGCGILAVLAISSACAMASSVSEMDVPIRFSSSETMSKFSCCNAIFSFSVFWYCSFSFMLDCRESSFFCFSAIFVSFACRSSCNSASVFAETDISRMGRFAVDIPAISKTAARMVLIARSPICFLFLIKNCLLRRENRRTLWNFCQCADLRNPYLFCWIRTLIRSDAFS